MRFFGKKEDVARIYKSNADASRALGITTQAFGRLCRQHGIETPHARRQRSSRRQPCG